jgi:two-component system, sensor histidine kinase and response regulator
MQATLFERLAGPEAAPSRRFGGSGLDLVISKRLVELMGGAIGARNLAESGFEFWVMLPLAPAADAAPRPRALPPKLHAIVLDADLASRMAASTILNRLEVEHDVTDLLPNALDLLRDANQDGAREQVLLVDDAVVANRPADLVRQLQDDPLLRKTRVVLLTRDSAAATSTASALAAVAVLTKPLLRLEPVIEAIGRSRTPAPVPATNRERPVVLVVDDDEISRSVASQLLERQGCTVEIATSGGAAIQRAQTHAFDLIFMDCQMPELDGFETTRRIRAALGAAAPSIVALTANTSPVDRERAFTAGMVDFIDKPVRRAELSRVLERWIVAKW